MESAVCHKSFSAINKLLANAKTVHHDNKQVLFEIKELSHVVLGRDIFKKQIDIIDGHNVSSYFWIMPVRIIDCSDTNEMDNIAEMRSSEISIEEDDVF